MYSLQRETQVPFACSRPTRQYPHMRARVRALAFVPGVFGVTLTFGCLAAQPDGMPSLDEAIASKRDLWGEAAMRQTNGASYEFFENLLPPPRYVNADFHYYPIVLSAPNAKVKARLISNGSGVNLIANGRQWHEVGTPASFRVGPDESRFGEFAYRFGHPTLAEGYLPIVQMRYLHQSPTAAEGLVRIEQKRVKRPSEIYQLEAFTSTDPALAENAVVFVKFTLPQGINGIITLQLDSKSELKVEDGKITDEQGRVLALYDGQWKKSVDNSGKWRYPRISAKLLPNNSATLAIPTKPLEASNSLKLDGDTYAQQRATCVQK